MIAPHCKRGGSRFRTGKKQQEIFVATATYERLFYLLATLLLAGCASDSDTYHGKHYDNLKQLGKIDLPPAAPTGNDKTVRRSGEAYPNAYAYTAGNVTGIYGNSAAVRDFIQHMVREHGFDGAYLNGLFSRANRLYSVIRLENAQQPQQFQGPARIGGWTRYRSKFLTNGHIDNGVKFWMNNADIIQKASAAYGVDPEYIVAIIGVETYFGRNTGRTRVFDALTTLAFDTRRRGEFFASELENFLLMTREESYDPFEPTGSWAGAMGLGQFMPSSFRRLAVDFDSDGRRDLWQSYDAIGSVAHYFSSSGWQLNEPVAERAGSFRDSASIALSTYNGDEYWRVYPNFKVIKSYNNSDKYAMAVHQLAQAIKQRYY
jgi:membrane-bound lytic murein transglycosylase B